MRRASPAPNRNAHASPHKQTRLRPPMYGVYSAGI
jgi:hypothetical protein